MTLAPPTPAKTDSDLFDSLTSPSRLDDYPRDSRAFVRIDASLRAYWHTLFDICPQLLDLSGPDGMAIFRPFMAFAAQQDLTFTWTYYLWVHHWLTQSEFRDRVDDDLLLALMAAAAARWAILDRGDDCGIVLGNPGFQGLVAGWKCRTIRTGRQVERLDPAEPLPAPDGFDGGFGCFTSPDFELDRFPGWRSIPR